MNNIIATMSQKVYILLTFIITIVAIAMIVLCFFITRYERRRYRESRVVDKEIKTVVLAEELKSMLIKAKSSTRFAILCVYINDYLSISAKVGAEGLSAMNDIIYRRLLSCLHYPATMSGYAKDKVAVIIKRHLTKAQIDTLNSDIVTKLKAPITTSGGSEICIVVNIATICYPAVGGEFTDIIAAMEYAIADARRSGEWKCKVVDSTEKKSTAGGYDTYMELNRAISSKAITLQYRRVMTTDEPCTVAIDCKIACKGSVCNDKLGLYSRALESGDSGWLDMLSYRKALIQLSPALKTNTIIKMIYPFSHKFIADGIEMAVQLEQAAATYGISPASIILEVDIKHMAKIELESIKVLTDSFNSRGFGFVVAVLDSTSIEVEKIRAIRPLYVKVDASMHSGESMQTQAKMLAELSDIDCKIIGVNVDDAACYDELSAYGIEYCMGDFVSPVISVARIIEEMTAK